VIQSCDVRISAPAARVFPLLCPVREFDWIDLWSCDLIYSDSGVAEYNCIFQTDREGEGKRTWVVNRYEPNKAIEFVIFQHDLGVIKMDLLWLIANSSLLIARFRSATLPKLEEV
jgi:hypothetical protein